MFNRIIIAAKSCQNLIFNIELDEDKKEGGWHRQHISFLSFFGSFL